ncbi:MFS transporter [Haloechinothrix sp. LS1_15]|uniref:MFS transporter n=1 Tax=Haloechinothrix sp. LS1_15 TaxID=2652248 RepID=UPI002944BF34|nr:MFS transporter [Haloechinothrix sp. LS1_15]MDV6012975.1 MFS transporter [Haloechinothrix sp. LS1_15]
MRPRRDSRHGQTGAVQAGTARPQAGTPGVSGTARSAAIAAGGVVVLLGALDTYVVIGLFREIIDDLAIPLNRLERLTPVVTGYLLGYVAAMPLLGQASDRYGRKAVLQLCLVAFLVGSAITAVAPSIGVLVTGRVVQGVAGGALLPVTMALAADLWSERRRPAVLGGIGAAQELGAVLGPVYGVALAALAGWRSVFWMNIPLAIIAIVAVHYALPGKTRPGRRARLRERNLPRRSPSPTAAAGARAPVDVVGGCLLAIVLGLLVVGLYNPEPAERMLPPWGMPLLVAAAVALGAFVLWEARARTKLLDTSGVGMRPFLAALGVSAAKGTALMATLVNVQLFAQSLLGADDREAIVLLLRFLLALPAGAVLGGLLTSRLGERWTAAVGMLIAACGLWLMSAWPADPLAAQHDLGLVALPRLDTDLVVVGIGLGLAIAPVSAAALRAVPPSQHGMASASVVVTRMTGMLVGLATLSAWGLHRFHNLTAELEIPLRPLYPSDEAYQADYEAYVSAVQQAMLTQYGEVFALAAVVCLVGTALAALLPRATTRSPTPHGGR